MARTVRRMQRAVTHSPETPGPNLLIAKLFTADVGDSSTEPGNGIAHATDQNTSTRWISQPQSPMNMTADLGGVYDLSRVVVVFAADTIRNYTVSVSTNGSSYTQIASGTTNNTESQTVNITSFSGTPKGRYLRITGVDRWNASYGNSIWEVEAYGLLDSSYPVGSITNFTATVASDTQLNLSWVYSGSPLSGYTLRRDGTVIASPAAGTTSYNNTGLTAGTTYSYTLSGTYTAGGETNAVGVVGVTGGGLPPVVKVMPLGDSITEGRPLSGNSWQGGYRKVLLDWLDANHPGRVDFVGSLTAYSGSMSDKDHEGRYGWRTDQIDSSITSWATAHQPDVVLLHLGSNDLIQYQSASSTASEVASVMTKIYAVKSSTVIILCTLIPLRLDNVWNPSSWSQFNAAITGLVTTFTNQGRAVVLADMATGAGIASSTADLPDGVHPSDSGYTKMANLFAAKLDELL